MFEIVLATGNKNKITEIRQILKDLNIKILTLNDFPGCPEAIEDGETFEENAYKKAYSVYSYTGIPALADDSGLEVDILGGNPGVRSARFAGENATSGENNRKLLEKLHNISFDKRTAYFRCVLYLLGSKINEKTEGACEGRIINDYRGENGFGYDPLFLYDPLNLTFAEMDSVTKNKISHRALAFRKMKKVLKEVAVRGEKEI